MAKIVCIETSTTVCSVAVGIDGKVISVNEINDGYSHAEQIEILLEKSLEEAKLTPKEIDAISVSKGPGSYTGLRIGVSLAKGLCYGLNIPLISIPTLEAMALHPALAAHQKAFIAPMLDARRMEVYACVLDKQHEIIMPTAAVIVDEQSFISQLEAGKVVFCGPGMDKCKAVLSGHENALFQEDVLPSAAQMVALSEVKLVQNKVEDMAYFEPFYLKDFVAGKPKKLL